MSSHRRANRPSPPVSALDYPLETVMEGNDGNPWQVRPSGKSQRWFRLPQKRARPQRVTRPQRVRPQRVRPQKVRPKRVRPQKVRPQKVRPQRRVAQKVRPPTGSRQNRPSPPVSATDYFLYTIMKGNDGKPWQVLPSGTSRRWVRLSLTRANQDLRSVAERSVAARRNIDSIYKSRASEAEFIHSIWEAYLRNTKPRGASKTLTRAAESTIRRAVGHAVLKKL